ncbi:MAG: aromatic amino acid transporter AroP, partial [Bifidobacterium sp.]|nr:aromatic amino acid transporter AroP [Bifidobacterium sp.]
ANVTPYVVIAFMLLVVVLMCFSASYRIAVIAGVIWLAVLFAAYQLTQVGRKQADASAADAE